MKLRVKANGQGMVPDIDSARRQYIGWMLDRTQGEKYEDIEIIDGRKEIVPRQQAVFVTSGVVEVPSYAEYVRSVKDGDLLPADQATADFCKVKFEGKTDDVLKEEVQ